MPSDFALSATLATPTLTTGIGTSVQKTDSPEKIKASAAQFEALLVGQILKAAHEEDGGWLGSGEDQTAGSAMQMADEYFAQALTAHGGLGLAKVITSGLEKASAESSTQPNPASSPSPVENLHKP
jgi:Rod binding domain-containing protein